MLITVLQMKLVPTYMRAEHRQRRKLNLENDTGIIDMGTNLLYDIR